ncbi:hypothetical protein C0991_000965 [Blastosporella zonata]|nr:hypothetical protein C0991_000965 [Blastosporella zonata]
MEQLPKEGRWEPTYWLSFGYCKRLDVLSLGGDSGVSEDFPEDRRGGLYSSQAHHRNDEDPFAALDEEDEEELLANTEAICTVIFKVQKLSFSIVNSTTRVLPVWYKTCASLGLHWCLIPRDVRTQWNSTFDMLQMALSYCMAVDAITADKALNLRHYELFDDEWMAISDVVSVLKVFKDATLYFSIDNKPSIANVIPTMDQIGEMLCINTADDTLAPAVRHALTFAWRHLNKYCSKTDSSNVYRIAMILHPKLKTKYFHQHGWDKRWIDTALEIVREEWAYYKGDTGVTPSSSLADISADFGDIPMTDIDDLNELDNYLVHPFE